MEEKTMRSSGRVISVGGDVDFLVACEVLVRGLGPSKLRWEEDREWSSGEGRGMEISL